MIFGYISLIEKIIFALLVFNLIKFIKNLRNKINNKLPFIEGLKNKKLKKLKKQAIKQKENLAKQQIKQNLPRIPIPAQIAVPAQIAEPAQTPVPANYNVVSQYTGIARRSGEYNNRIFNKLEDQINRLLMKDYGQNYMDILDRFDYLLGLKMLDNTLTVDFDNENQMLSKIEKINKYGDAKKFIEDLKGIVSLEMSNNGM